ncbi:MAG: NAD-binding protein [Candidatus Nanopelagicales bacterium]
MAALRSFTLRRQRPDPGTPTPTPGTEYLGTGVFMVLRRMRMPLIVLVTVFSVSVLGLTIIPGQAADGSRSPMSFFDAFYFVSYTATTIGFGEIPDTFTYGQRMWVALSIYLAVIGWAYSIGTILSLLQDRTFRLALERQHFARTVRRIAEPFLLVVGYGDAGRQVVHTLDEAGRRVVVVDRSADRVQALELEALHADIAALAGDARNPSILEVAGLSRLLCEGVLALTDDDTTNLAVVQAVHLLRPGLPVVARVTSRATGRHMRQFGNPRLVNPFDSFGDELRIVLRAPVTSQLRAWLSAPVGDPLGPLPAPPHPGSWVVVGDQGVVHEVVADLQADALPVSLVPAGNTHGGGTDPQDPGFLELVKSAVGVVAASESDSLNLSYVAAARTANPEVFVIARQDTRRDTPLFAAIGPDLLLVPAEVTAREVWERLKEPALWEFLDMAAAAGEDWSRQLLSRLLENCGPGSPQIWQARITPAEAPALCELLGSETVRLGDLLSGRWSRLAGIVALSLTRGGQASLAPADGTALVPGDVLLLASHPAARRTWYSTADDAPTLSLALTGVSTPSTWWGRLVLGKRS